MWDFINSPNIGETKKRTQKIPNHQQAKWGAHSNGRVHCSQKARLSKTRETLRTCSHMD